MSHYARLSGFSIAAILLAAAVNSARAVTIATVPVGYAGNAPDPEVMITDGTSGYGAVPYNYRIGAYDVTNAQYVEFLNAKASAADPYGLWNQYMDPSSVEGAISRSAFAPYTYSVRQGFANKPIVWLTWYDAVRFVNWLQNGQGNGDTESGTYTISGGGSNSGAVTVPDASQRATWAASGSFHWLLPSENEWYKAAYFNPGNRKYYFFPFQGDSLPEALAPPGSANSGDFYSIPLSSYPAFNYDGSGSYLTDVGAYPKSLSPFGCFDMGGDAGQWNESDILGDGTMRAVRGDDWENIPSLAASNFSRETVPADDESSQIGFRVASVGSVPEPSTGLLAALACGMIWCSRRRFKPLAQPGRTWIDAVLRAPDRS